MPEPLHLGNLQAKLLQRWPMTSRLEVLKETDLRVGLTTLFTSATGSETLDRETLQRRLLLCLCGLGTNTGLERVANGDHGTESQADLRYVRRGYIRQEVLRAAIATAANTTFRARRPEIWGEGTTACASAPRSSASGTRTC